MANDLNSCQFIGRLGRDPEQKSLPSGDLVTNFSIAVGWKGKDKEGTEWVNIVAFGKLAEIIGKYCQKGQQIYIEGSMRTRKWQDKEGADRYSTEVVANKMQMLGAKGESSDAPSRPSAAPSRSSAPEAGIPFDDDIPFMRLGGPW